MNPCKLMTESIDEDKVKQWYICQIEDKRDALNEAQKSQAENVDLEEVNRQLEILNAEKKRRGYR
ncbi:MAG: hypothetical protein IKU44_01350 [Firmicutes bacterium]|nr:hypothetical protein [Bacillota bacterium]